MTTTNAQQMVIPKLLPTFGDNFLADHAGLLISDPTVALVELVANCWDAGADQVEIAWPEKIPGPVEIKDNGTGMTRDEFLARWLELNYNRLQVQGEAVQFPKGQRKGPRTAFGRNGKGRHAMFCFAGRYYVDTWKEGTVWKFEVTRSSGQAPFTLVELNTGARQGHGTTVSAVLDRNHLPLQQVRDLIGSKFVMDPSFVIYINGQPVELQDLEHLCETEEIDVGDAGRILIRRYDSTKTGRTSKQHGVAWWVKKRLVGEPSWKDVEGAYLDARTAEAKRASFVVEADLLAKHVKADWTDFRPSELVNQVKQVAHGRILQQLQDLMQNVRRARRDVAIEQHRELLQGLPPISQEHVVEFLEEIQKKCPTMGQDNLSDTVEVLAKLEKSRSGYGLMEQLSKLPPDDLDQLTALLEKWTVQDMRLVLDELHHRLKLIETLRKLVFDPSADELHEIQPIFEHGLWIFGPEYESLLFRSNRSLATLVKTFFERRNIPVAHPKNRPDLIALPNTSIGLYSRPSFNTQNEVCGCAKVLIVELKKGGSVITRVEPRQPQDYSADLRSCCAIQRDTEVEAYVLGAAVAEDAQEDITEGRTVVRARSYATVLEMANARTFYLLHKLQEAGGGDSFLDPTVKRLLETPPQMRMEEA